MDGLLYINKPQDWTSFDVVAKIRKALKIKSIGHTGTLDPQATGVLIVMLGKACKANPYLVHDTKEYRCTVQLGKQYDTADIWGKIIQEQAIPSFDKTQIETIFQSMVKVQLQTPPMYSAVKVNGKKLYEYARENKTVEVAPRRIEIMKMELLSWNHDEIEFRIQCSSGTYVRVVCEQIAEQLNTVGAMSSLVREQVASISLAQCQSLDEILQGNVVVHSTLQVLQSRYPSIEVMDEGMLKQIMDGKRVSLSSDEPLVCLYKENQAVAMFERTDEGNYRSKRGLW